MTVRPDVRLETAPMHHVRCDLCLALVEVRKASWEQTSIQWHQDSATQCMERQHAVAVPGRLFPGCTAMRDSIRRAAVSGEIDVLQPDGR